MEKSKKYLIYLFVSLVLIKIALSIFVTAPSAFSDEYFYSKIARSFFNTLPFSVYDNQPINLYPPLYPIIISIAYIFKNMEVVYFIIKLINILVSSLIIFPAFFLAKEFLDSKKALFIAILVSLIPSHFLIFSYVLSENLFYLLFLTTLYFMYIALTKPSPLRFVLLGLFMGLSYLTKNIAVVLPIIFLISFVVYLYKTKKYQLISKILLAYFIALLTILPWLIRNFFLFNNALGNSVANESSNLTEQNAFLLILIWFVLYIGYFYITSLVIFAHAFFSSLFSKIKDDNFLLLKVISLSSFILLTMIAAIHNVNNLHYTTFLTGRVMGRYVDVILPLFFILGGIVISKKLEITTKLYYLTIPCLISFSVLLLFPLFPVNNINLTHFGLLASLFSLKSSVIIYLILAIILILLLPKLSKLSLKKLVLPCCICLILISACALAVIDYNAYTGWYSKDQMQAGLWLNNYNPEPSNILIDESYEGKILKTNQTSLYENMSDIQKSSILGFWLNDNIFIDDINNTEGIDYIITYSDLDYPLIKKQGEINIYELK